MNTPQSTPETEVLSVHDCWTYLRSSSVGRLAVTGIAGPEIFPVNYLPEDGTLVFRTGPGTKLDAVLGGGTVAFEADGLNAYGTIAWSVIAKGLPEAVPSNEDELETAELAVSPWEPGVKDHLIRINLTEISGRRFVISPTTNWWLPRDPSRAGNQMP